MWLISSFCCLNEEFVYRLVIKHRKSLNFRLPQVILVNTFLYVYIFVSPFNWKAHIDDLLKNVSPYINLLKMLSSTQWVGDPEIMTIAQNLTMPHHSTAQPVALNFKNWKTFITNAFVS